MVGSEDHTVSLWSIDAANNSSKRHYKASHKGPISGISFHPLNEYAVASSTDGSWSFHNIIQGVDMGHYLQDAAIHDTQFHPDGLLLAMGLETGAINVLDIRS